MERKTIFSDCRKYRYTLWREWGDVRIQTLTDPHFDHYIGTPDKFVQFIGLNPSTADETKNDNTVTRCINFAKAWGFGAMCMTNLFAYRATDPKEMKKHPHPVSPIGDTGKNTDMILEIADKAALIVCAWGKDGRHNQRENYLKGTHHFRGVILKMRLHNLGLNGDGTPKHPLYLKATTQPQLWET